MGERSAQEAPLEHLRQCWRGCFATPRVGGSTVSYQNQKNPTPSPSYEGLQQQNLGGTGIPSSGIRPSLKPII